MTPITGNTFPVKDALKALGGKWDGATKAWLVPDHVADEARALVPAAPAAKPKAMIGDVQGIVAMFHKAQQHLKYPKIVLATRTDIGAVHTVRMWVAGPQSKAPGTLSIVSGEKNQYGDRDWYGRVTLGGMFEPSKACPDYLANRLRQFACDPAGVAADSAKLAGRCCFCNQELTDERSTDVGYGAICADHFGLPWGK